MLPTLLNVKVFVNGLKYLITWKSPILSSRTSKQPPPPSKLKHKIFWKASLLLFCPRSSCQLYFEFLRETDWSRPAEGNVSYSILHIVFSYDTHAISHGKLTPPMRTSMHLCICINSQKQEPGIKYNTQKSLFLSSPLPLKLCAHVVDLILTFSLGQC